MSAAPKLMKRRRIHKDEIAVIMDRMQLGYIHDDGSVFTVKDMVGAVTVFGVCECGCGQGFNGMQLEWDHTIPNAMLYEGDDIDWRAYRKDCHLLKTKVDVARIAKAKRQGGETGQYARRKRREKPLINGRGDIASRPFDKLPEGRSAWGNSRGFKRDWKPNVRDDS